MSSEALSVPRPRRRHGWLIPTGIGALLVASLLASLVYLVGPAIKIGMSFVGGNPSLPGCRTTIVSEATAGPLWNRILDVNCPRRVMHFVFVKRSPNQFVAPAFMSTDGPAPVSVRQTGENEFEIVLATPLADGRTGVPVKLNQNGFVTEFQ
jgi:hypothetical protein